MLIDWFTVGAQAFNFLILVWLMKRFLYKPVLGAIAAREKLVAGRIADAGAKQAEAEKEKDEFRQKNDEIDASRADLLAKAKDEADDERTRLLAEAREAADALAAKRGQSMENDAQAMAQALKSKLSREVFAIARKALTDLAESGLEDRMVGVFLRNVRSMEGDAAEAFARAIKSGPDPAVLRSAFELPPEQRASLQKGLNEAFSADVHLRFETEADLIGGIELSIKDQRVAWSISDYLSSMQKEVADLLKKNSEPVSDKSEVWVP